MAVAAVALQLAVDASYCSMAVDVFPYFVLVVLLRTHSDSRYQKSDFESAQQPFVVAAAVVVMT